MTERTQLQRDPFARMTLERETVRQCDRRGCTWCGNPAKFRYGWVSDQNNRFDVGHKMYCSVDCWRSYND